MRYRLLIISLISSQLLAIPSDVYHLVTSDRFLPKSFLMITLTTVEDPLLPVPTTSVDSGCFKSGKGNYHTRELPFIER